MKMREPKIGRKERIEIWLLCRTVLDCKDGLIKKSEAIAEFSKHSGLPPLMARMIFEPMFKESKAHLKSSYPDWIKPPEFEDYQRTGTRDNKTLKKRKPRGKPPTKPVHPEQSGDTPP
jgi:hypothetical protein